MRWCVGVFERSFVRPSACLHVFADDKLSVAFSPVPHLFLE